MNTMNINDILDTVQFRALKNDFNESMAKYGNNTEKVFSDKKFTDLDRHLNFMVYEAFINNPELKKQFLDAFDNKIYAAREWFFSDVASKEYPRPYDLLTKVGVDGFNKQLEWSQMEFYAGK